MRLIAIIAAALASGAAAQEAPLPRAASLDFCADQYLLALAEPSQIVAVSPVADEDDSYMRAEARGLRLAHPTTEEIAPLRPDVVFRFWGGSHGMAETLGRFGATVLTLDYPDSFETVRENIRIIAAALNRIETGEKLLADLDRRLHALEERPPTDIRALYVTPGGVTAGKGTMIDAILAAAGVKNAAAEAGLEFWPPLPAETLVLDPPDMIVAGFFEATTEYVNHWSAARHPVFQKTFKQTPNVHLRAELISCPAWFSLEAAETIADFIQSLSKRADDPR